MKIDDTVKALITKHFKINECYERRLFLPDILKLIEKQEKAAYEKGYEAGRWDRSTNTSKPWREPD